MRIFKLVPVVVTIVSLLFCSAVCMAVQAGTITVDVGHPGVKISPDLYGLMTEEINHSYDGGLYAELIRNRCFTALDGWSVSPTTAGSMSASPDVPPNTAMTQSLMMHIDTAAPNQQVGLSNDGYWGIPVAPKTVYRCTFYAKSDPAFRGPLVISLVSNSGSIIYASAKVAALSTEWKTYAVTLHTGQAAASTANHFVISDSHPGTIWLDQVSLFPPTYNNRPNGLRIDLMNKLAAMKPAFLRFPGGNYLEGNSIAQRFDWKKTIHGIAQRPGHESPWGYWSDDGLGLLEFLEWCEDLKIKPVLAVFAGFALNHEHVVAGPELTPYVQDALDEIEYATGSASTKWGRQRVLDGHPAPFKVEYVEVGNEDFFDRAGSYDGRFAQFFDAIKADYPDIKVIATRSVASRVPDFVDDHFYRSASAMAHDSHHYDGYNRKGPKIFVGEWASTEGSPTPTLKAALGDAAWLTGLERNSDVVTISCYAPLLVNVGRGARQWGTNLIGYDAGSSFGSPSYYAQAMNASSRGDVVLPVTMTSTPTPTFMPALPPLQGSIGLGTWATQAEFQDAVVTSNGSPLYTSDFTKNADAWQKDPSQWSVQNGMLVQGSGDTNVVATTGDSKWTDYTYSVRARKISGNEGFLIVFHYKDAGNYIWWNVGGWNDTRTGLQRANDGEVHEIGTSKPNTVETGRWYNLKVVLAGRSIRCYVDNTLISEATDDSEDPDLSMYSTASRDLKSGDVILKVVNSGPMASPTSIKLTGRLHVATKATSVVLKGQPNDINTIAEPTKIVPVVGTISGVGTNFEHEFPPYSYTILRIHSSTH